MAKQAAQDTSAGDTGLLDTGVPVVCPDQISGTGCGGVREAESLTCGGREASLDEVVDPDAISGGGCHCAANGSMTSWPLWIPLMMWVFRRLFLSVMLMGTAQAQMNAEHVRLLDGGDFAALWEADLGAPWTLYATLSLTSAADLVVIHPDQGRSRVLLDRATSRTLSTSFNLAGYTRIGVALPHQSHSFEGAVGKGPADRTVWMSVPLTDGSKSFDGSFTVAVVLSSGPDRVYLSDPGSTKANLSLAFPLGPAVVIANVGPTLQSGVALPSMVWGSHWSYGLGIRVEPVGPLFATVELLGEAPVKFWSGSAVYHPNQMLGQLGTRIGNTVRLSAGGGAGLGTGLGSPSHRFLMVLDFHKEAPEDQDGDGIDDLRDMCRDIPEDKDGYRDRDGCPELDNDLDGFVDKYDDCPMEAETVNGVDDHDGCPDRNLRLVVSADAPVEQIQWQIGDRSLQSFSGESLTVEGVQGALLVFTTAEGHQDQENWVNFDGGDTQTLHLVLEPLPPLVVRTESRLELSDEVSFTLNDAQLDPASMPILGDVAGWMNAHPEIHLLRVEGRADEVGRSRYNLALSQQRAEGVRDALITAGVAPERLQALGSGEALAGDGPDRSVDFVVLVWEE